MEECGLGIFIYLKGEKTVIEKRLKKRKGHFAGADILDSQLEALEEPEDAIVEEIDRGPDSITDDILSMLDKQK